MFVWTLLTFWAEAEGPRRIEHAGNTTAAKQALIVYDPDPFYNFDEQVCDAFGKVLIDSGWGVTTITVAAAKDISDSMFSLFVFCANTYNWSPDRAVRRFIKRYQRLEGKNAVAITLGAGSTGRSKRILEKRIKEKKARLLSSKIFWLWRPNDQTRTNEKNVKVALEMVTRWAKEITVDSQ